MSKPKITQQMRYRKSLIDYASKHGVTKASRIYITSRQNIYRYIKKYNGDIRSLANLSHKPKSHPNVKRFKFRIYVVRTDNGPEFTKRLISNDPNDITLFELALKRNNIRHDLIKPYTPKHNGKVERSHRKDNEQFYSSHRFYSLENANNQLQAYLKEYNNFPMQPLKWKSPNELLRDYFNKLK